jgi:hypothetical protein
MSRSTSHRINIWSSPRNLSTALMYSWRQRADTTVVDEPLYAHYLVATGAAHPGRDDVLAAQDHVGARVVDEVMRAEYPTPIVVFKQMAKHLVGLDRSFLTEFDNVLLTRDPYEMLTSFQVNVPEPTLEETGFVELNELLDTILAAGDVPIVVDAKLLLIDPPSVLSELCDRLGVAFDEAMLAWPAGPKPEDGVWAPHWYAGVHASTGWQPHRAKEDVLDGAAAAVHAQAVPLYERLLPYRIGGATG